MEYKRLLRQRQAAASKCCSCRDSPANGCRNRCVPHQDWAPTRALVAKFHCIDQFQTNRHPIFFTIWTVSPGFQDGFMTFRNPFFVSAGASFHSARLRNGTSSVWGRSLLGSRTWILISRILSSGKCVSYVPHQWRSPSNAILYNWNEILLWMLYFLRLLRQFGKYVLVTDYVTVSSLPGVPQVGSHQSHLTMEVMSSDVPINKFGIQLNGTVFGIHRLSKSDVRKMF